MLKNKHFFRAVDTTEGRAVNIYEPDKHQIGQKVIKKPQAGPFWRHPAENWKPAFRKS